MRYQLFYYSLALTRLIAFLPITLGVLPNALQLTVDAGNLSQVVTLKHRANEAEFDGEEDIPFKLGSCVPRCMASKESRESGRVGKKRSVTLPQPLNNSTNPSNRFAKRAQPLPAFNGPDDLRRKTRDELGSWIMRRMPDPRRHRNDVEMLWNPWDKSQKIDMRRYRSTTWAQTVGIPTSFFQRPGETAFAWGTIALVGCSVLAVVKAPTDSDQRAGVYLAHIWEVPGFSNMEDDNGKTLLLAQPQGWIRDFFQEGFPPPNAGLKKRIPENEREWETAFQEGLNNHGTHLGNGDAIVMHPQQYNLVDRDGREEYVLGEGPQYPDGLNLLRDTVDQVMRSNHKSAVNWLPDYLYVPAREDPKHERAWTTPSGRTLFEYDPNFSIGDGQTTRMGMLLFEDGGPQGPQNPDGTYQPGPGGPFFYDFGKP